MRTRPTRGVRTPLTTVARRLRLSALACSGATGRAAAAADVRSHGGRAQPRRTYAATADELGRGGCRLCGGGTNAHAGNHARGQQQPRCDLHQAAPDLGRAPERRCSTLWCARWLHSSSVTHPAVSCSHSSRVSHLAKRARREKHPDAITGSGAAAAPDRAVAPPHQPQPEPATPPVLSWPCKEPLWLSAPQCELRADRSSCARRPSDTARGARHRGETLHAREAPSRANWASVPPTHTQAGAPRRRRRSRAERRDDRAHDPPCPRGGGSTAPLVPTPCSQRRAGRMRPFGRRGRGGGIVSNFVSGGGRCFLFSRCLFCERLGLPQSAASSRRRRGRDQLASRTRRMSPIRRPAGRRRHATSTGRRRLTHTHTHTLALARGAVLWSP